jgi:hypothetical protein
MLQFLVFASQKKGALPQPPTKKKKKKKKHAPKSQQSRTPHIGAWAGPLFYNLPVVFIYLFIYLL